MPPTPSSVKAMLPTASSTFCSRMKKLLEFPRVLFDLVSYFFTETGTFTTEFKTAICALPCAIGGGTTPPTPPPNANMPAPTNLFASDGAFSDHVHITWTEPTPPTGVAAITQYKLYRSLSTNSNANLATFIANIAAPASSYDDSTAVAGTIYRYWLRATNGTDTSAYSTPDLGSAAVPLETLDAISDLTISQGFSFGESAPVKLQWTPPAAATAYDVWRNTVNTFATATKIASAVAPQDPEQNITSDTSPDAMWDNGVRIVFHHFPPSAFTKFYYWVVARADSPPAVSPASNAVQGWVATNYSPYTGGRFNLNRAETVTEGIDFTGTKIRVALFGGGGAGAGGSQNYGGGGGGASAVVIEEFVISAGATLSLEAVDNVDETAAAPALSDGDDGSTMIFKISGVSKMQCDAGGGGVFSASGGGTGGVANGGSGTTSPTIYPGFAGQPGSGAAGGASGFSFGDRRYPAAHFDNFSLGGWSGDGPAPSFPGGGSHAAPGIEVLAVGGKGRSGYAVISFGV